VNFAASRKWANPLPIRTDKDGRLTTNFSVVTPVGPRENHRRWFPECLESVRSQSLLVVQPPNLVFEPDERTRTHAINLSWEFGPWCINIGIEAALSEWIVVLCSDDYLLPDCLKLLDERIRRIGRQAFYLRFPMIDSDGVQLPGGNCFHKDLWRTVGGYPYGIQTMDQEMVSSIMLDPTIEQPAVWDSMTPPLLYHRRHPDQWSKTGRWPE
jgi:hypothetical protein